MERSVYLSLLIVMRFDVLRAFRRADLKLSRHLLIYNLPVIDMLSLMKDRRKANVTKINRSIDRSNEDVEVDQKDCLGIDLDSPCTRWPCAMSVLLVTDDVDDDLHIFSSISSSSSTGSFYKQLKELEHDSPASSSSSSATSFSILESSSSIIVKSNQYYRQHRRRRSRRLQPCWVQPLLTSMFTFLFLSQHLNWSIVFFVTIMSQPVTTATTTIIDDQQCLPLHGSQIDRLCSKTCLARRNPFGNVNQILSDMLYLPFCSQSLLNRSINFNANSNQEWSELECRKTFEQLIKFDEEARRATLLFSTYMKAIDSASHAHRYSIINADCQVSHSDFCSRRIDR